MGPRISASLYITVVIALSLGALRGQVPLAFGPPDQTAVPGQPLSFTATGPAGTPLSILVDVAPATSSTVYGVLGLATTPSLYLAVDGIGIAGPLGLPPAGGGAQIPGSGTLTIQSPPVSAGSVGLERWAQAVVPDPSTAAGYTLSTNGATIGNMASCHVLVAPDADLAVSAIETVDVNYVEPLFTSFFGIAEDIDPSITFHDDETPAGRVSVQNTGGTTRTCRIRYALHTGSSGATTTAVAQTTSAPFSVIAGSGTQPLHKTPEFPNLRPHPPGIYTFVATLLAEHPAGSGAFVPSGAQAAVTITVTSRRPLLLVHGIIEDGTRFQDLGPMLEALSPDPIPVRRFSYASDDGAVPGLLGKSAEFAAFIAHTGVSEYDIAAHSLGALIIRHHILNNPPSGWTPRLVLFGGCNMGVSLAFNSLGVSILSGATPGGLSSSQFLDDIKPASAFITSLANGWHNVAPLVRVLNVIGTNCGGNSDGIVLANEAYMSETSNAPGTVLNRYVDEIHGTIPAFLSLFSLFTPCSLPAPGIGVFDAATASSRPSWHLVRDFLTAANPMAIATPSGVANNPPASANRGQLWIPLIGAGPAGGLFYASTSPLTSTMWWNGETNTFVWVDAPTSGGASACLNALPLGCLFSSTCSLPAGTAIAGQTRRTLPAAFGSSCTLLPDTSVYPY